MQQTVQRVASTLYLLDAKTEEPEGVIPLPEWIWLTLMEHRERQDQERAASVEIWQDYGLVLPSDRGPPWNQPI